MELLEQLVQSGAWVDFTQGLDARLLTEQNIQELNRVKLTEIHFAWDYMQESDAVLRGLHPVSYTHLTLPTIYSV
mgnify:CR=1 FL=1